MATKWGILSAGIISHDFVNALSSLSRNEHEIVAVAARDLSRAESFAKKFDIGKAYGSYKQLAEDENIDVVYIGSINTEHFKYAKMMLDGDKAVLCEKPLCITKKQTEELINYARKKGKFLMEAIWSRFTPAYDELRKMIASKSYGEIKQVICSFGYDGVNIPRVNEKSLGGGSVLDIGIYCCQFTSLVYGIEKPLAISALGHLNQDGVDESTCSILKYSDGRLATLNTSLNAPLPNEARIISQNGIIKVPFPFWAPTKIETPTEVHNFDEPHETKYPFIQVNSLLLKYEAQEVRKCLNEGLLESPKLTLDESLFLSQLMESIRKQVGVSYPEDEI